MFARRGIDLNIARQFYTGYIHRAYFRTQLVKFSFILPLFAPNGRLLGLKIHRDFRGEGESKCKWIISAENCKALWPPPEWARHAELPKYICDWAEPWIDRFEGFRSVGAKSVEASFRDDLAEWQARKSFGAANALVEYDGRWLFLCGGELKALAMICAGFWATAPMTGENNFWTPEILSRLADLRICILFDEDKQGREFRDATISALLESALEIRAITLGVKQNGVKLDANDVAASGGNQGLTSAVTQLLQAATPINTDEWRKTHPPAYDAKKSGILSEDMDALEIEYRNEYYAGYSRADRHGQYEKYLAHYPPAISGDGGHRTLLLAVAHRHGFAVSIDDAINGIRGYNVRCVPPWSDKEIQRKLETAKPLASFPPGSRLSNQLTDDEMLDVVFTPK